MNERIQQLAEQAGDTEVVNTVDYGSGRIDNVLVKVFNKEKFAELIVRECVLETMDAIHHDTSIRLQVYKHFGIEQ